MKLAIFGATGTVGSELLTQSLGSGHEVRALVRNPSKLPGQHPQATVVHGDARDLGAVKQSVDGCDAVLSTLGSTHKHNGDVRCAGTANILAAMRVHGIRRLVVMGVFFLPFPGDPRNVGRKLVVPVIKLMGIVVEDTTGVGALLQASDLDWTLVRAPRVVCSKRTAPVRTGTLKLGPWSKVARASVASFMLQCLTEPTSIRQAPMISDQKQVVRLTRCTPSVGRPGHIPKGKQHD